MPTPRPFSELFNRWLTFFSIAITEFLYGLLQIKAVKSYTPGAGALYYGNLMYYIFFTLLVYYWYPDLRKKENWTFIMFTFIIFGLYVYCDLMATMYFALDVYIVAPLQTIAALLYVVCVNTHSEIKTRLGKSFRFFFLALALYFYFVHYMFVDHEHEHPYAIPFFMKIVSGIWWQACVLFVLESTYSLKLKTFKKESKVIQPE